MRSIGPAVTREPLLYAAALLGVHICGNGGSMNMEKAGLLIGMGAVSLCLMLLQAMKKKNRGKKS